MENKRGTQAGGGGVNIIINGILAYYFYQYAFNNPDEGSCWASSGSRMPSAIEQGGYKNVT